MGVRKKKSRGGARPGAGRPPMLTDRARILVYVDGSVARVLAQRARSKGTSVSEYVREVLTQHVKRARRR